jgi:adenylate cyclase class 2
LSTANGIETEVKIRLSDADDVQRRLTEAGFTVAVARTFEANTLYDAADGRLRATEMLLRLRQFGAKSVLTWKGPGVPGPHKSRPELETTVGSLETLDQILRALGYEPAFLYEKYRTEYKQPESASEGTVTLDETPIGNFLELEGAADWIDHTAATLGFEQSAYVLSSYASLYRDYCAARGLEPQNMVFARA